jgi:hypothetical protein
MSTVAKVGASNTPRVIVGRLERVRRGKRTAFEVTTPEPAADRQSARVALTLALAHGVQRAIDAGEIRDQAEAAQKLGTSRARITQILDLTLLSPRIQEVAIAAETVGEAEPVTERAIRQVLRYDGWVLQEAFWASKRRR